ncbi:MAG: DEAD/DEAH box helicase [Chthoniobacterales bacterium]
MPWPFETSLDEIDWIARPRLTQLRRLEIETVGDLLRHYPRRHEDRREFLGFPRDESDQPICLCGDVTKTQIKRFGGWKKIFEVTLEETEAHALSQPLVLRWFNVHYVQKMIVGGQRLVVFGKPRLRGKRICMEHPEFEIIENDDEISIHFRRITPVYAATEGLSSRVLRAMIHRLLGESESDDLATLRELHFPESWESLGEARESLVLEEFLALQMVIAARRARSRARGGGAHCGDGRLLDRFLDALPFRLTNAQARVLEEIRDDLSATIPMNRLLQGDVGSGKTVVAIASMLLAIESGHQAALMAPTQILAEQHYAVLQRWLEPLGVDVSLRTGARKEDPLPLFAQNREIEIPGSTGGPPVASGGSPGAPSVRYGKRRLPHFERPWGKYAITFATHRKRLLSPASRQAVLDCVLHRRERRYELYAACVMPDHVHLLIEPGMENTGADGEAKFFPLTEILHTIKSFTAHTINRLEKTRGPVWVQESFDRLVRSERDLQEKFDYITRNPWDAGIVPATESYPFVWWPGCALDEGAARQDRPASRRTEQASGLCSPEAEHLRGQIFVGTHALLYEPEGLENPGLVVIDEQHKFGVSQRARLTNQEPAPDVLVMTATPIPRTLTMSLYGDLDVSTIDELPADRGRIVTAARDENKLPDVLAFLRRELEAGRQIYIVYPLIDESEKLAAKAASAEFAKWQERLAPFTCELLHGRIAAPEKQATMERFRHGLTSVLVSTTVIEVGVDVANATVMLIENAERFGLAQLHQLRGRIGRGVHKSYCILLSSDPSEETRKKLEVLEKTSNGFTVAEADWEMRGPGDLLGTAQSGLPDLKLGDLRTDVALMQRARAAATKIFRDDPELAQPENQRFRALVVEEENFSHVS